ncbi:hypothetical protein J2754_000347 [Halarchaeum solikamskense]|uniref:hypothetical protein n=1 Tax=Halarchaeum nitratireducens TaxID=489913 RepID=UPI001B3B104A|nr:hypothetical protein [Halarchaeum solikamskense]MBP2250050.1 hypothetical protein [Halarchaeum solikamskense]
MVASALAPVALGFFGLGTGYFIIGGTNLFGFPEKGETTRQTLGSWGIWMPGFLQFVTGILLWGGLTWFDAFRDDHLLYMAALAFTAYGVHWFVLGWKMYKGFDPRPDAWMAIAFLLLSVLGTVNFYLGGVLPVAVLFFGLTLVYLSEIWARFTGSETGEKSVALFQVLTGIWLMYLTYAVTLDIGLGWALPK